MRSPMTVEDVLRRLFEAGLQEDVAVAAGVLTRCDCGAVSSPTERHCGACAHPLGADPYVGAA